MGYEIGAGMEAVVAAVMPVVAGIVIACVGFFSSRSNTSQTGANEFREDLIVRLAAVEAKFERAEERARLADARNADQSAHIVVLTQWGMYSTEAAPRTPPPWRQAT